MFAPESTPVLGPLGVPPPHEYGTPICEAPRRITYSIACGPRTRPTPTLPVLAPPPLLPPRPMLWRNFWPRLWVVCIAIWVASNDALAIANRIALARLR
jgi:hypothetical protein